MTHEETIKSICNNLEYLETQRGDFSVAYNYGHVRGQIYQAWKNGDLTLEDWKQLSDKAEEIFKKLVDSGAVSYYYYLNEANNT